MSRMRTETTPRFGVSAKPHLKWRLKPVPAFPTFPSRTLKNPQSAPPRMDQAVFTYTDTPTGLLDLLSAHLPFSLPLFRRLQFTKLKGGISTTSRIVFASDSGKEPRDAEPGGEIHFAAAYVDPAAGPETQVWVYSTLEDGELPPDGAEVAARLIASVVDRIRSIGREYDGDLAYPGGLLVGTLHASVQQAMDVAGIGFELRSRYGYDKWLFRADELPASQHDLPDGLYWSVATREDCEVVISRTDLPRQAYCSSSLYCAVLLLTVLKGILLFAYPVKL